MANSQGQIITLSYHIIHVKGNLEVILVVLRLRAILYIFPAATVAGQTLSWLYDGRFAGDRPGHGVSHSHGTRRSSHGGESLARLPQTDTLHTLRARLGHCRRSVGAGTPLGHREFFYESCWRVRALIYNFIFSCWFVSGDWENSTHSV